MTDILMIEDDPELGTLLRDFLLRADFTVRTCTDAEQGLAALQTEPFRLVLLDVMLPGKDGYRTCTEIRKKQSVPVLMMSAVPGDTLDQAYVDEITGILREFRAPGTIGWLEREAFYRRSRGAMAVVSTGEVRKYGNLILKKGVTPLA